ncbi:C40 family peptidase [Streptomyces sp. TRM66268-LWL]|uniref:C40 family peptidase n=1 Tax=Streptomyces polyasparticus TaxID=2767826 RepID=A0ABR7S778_9ACTN|nr:C40 family peptidase [Streptomyces polyasparticus]MBC9711305.1 C40 family peptidase [Streptomyces polyasparticus]
MSGRVLRLVCAAAVVAAGVVGPAGGALSAPEPEPVGTGAPSASAEGAPTDPADGLDALTDPAEGADTPTDPVDGADPLTDPLDAADPLTAPFPSSAAGEKSVAGLLAELQKLYRAAEQATEKYNATAEQLKKQTAEARKKSDELSRARLALSGSRLAAGRLARQMYQGESGFDGYVRLLLSPDPQTALDQKHVIGRLARERVQTVGRLTADERKADELATAARKALDKQQVLAGRQKKQRDAVVAKLKAVEKLLASLSAAQIAEVRKLEASGTAAAQSQFLASAALPGPGGAAAPSRAGAEVVRWALAQVGKPYAAGARGPRAFDASGLTAAAWERAGIRIPRTGRAQWSSLEKVPLRSARPGDVVVYGPDAVHVALYIGDGKVVDAPRPGARVSVGPVGGRQVLGVVRPDPNPATAPGYRAP